MHCIAPWKITHGGNRVTWHRSHTKFLYRKYLQYQLRNTEHTPYWFYYMNNEELGSKWVGAEQINFIRLQKQYVHRGSECEWTLFILLIPAECRDVEFTCDNGQCISRDQLCNGLNDCGDLSDELRACSTYTHSFTNRDRCIKGSGDSE